MLKGVLMDIDGTMLDSNVAHAIAWSSALDEHGVDVPPERILPLVGMGGDKLLEQVTGLAPESERGKRILKRSDEVFATRLLPHLKPFARVRDLLLEFLARGLVLAVATSAGKRAADLLLRQTGVEDLLRVVATSDDAKDSKPDPDIVTIALERAFLSQTEAVLIGDTPYDVASAQRAGIACLAVRCGGWTTRDLRGAAAVYDDPADILSHLDTPPLDAWFSAARP